MYCRRECFDLSTESILPDAHWRRRAGPVVPAAAGTVWAHPVAKWDHDRCVFVEMLHCTDFYDYVDSEKEPLGFKTIQTMCWECSCCMSHVWFLGVNNRILTLFGFVMNPHTVLIVAAGLVQHRAGYDHF